mmetsp:Transcript_16059/g.25448  ORF Transcript_16059/g.25448 Transcript_16059/m.25448 type:complete len:256 (+) Transcript_16059:1588-2355(+)
MENSLSRFPRPRVRSEKRSSFFVYNGMSTKGLLSKGFWPHLKNTITVQISATLFPLAKRVTLRKLRMKFLRMKFLRTRMRVRAKIKTKIRKAILASTSTRPKMSLRMRTWKWRKTILASTSTRAMTSLEIMSASKGRKMVPRVPTPQGMRESKERKAIPRASTLGATATPGLAHMATIARRAKTNPGIKMTKERIMKARISLRNTKSPSAVCTRTKMITAPGNDVLEGVKCRVRHMIFWECIRCRDSRSYSSSFW